MRRPTAWRGGSSAHAAQPATVPRFVVIHLEPVVWLAGLLVDCLAGLLADWLAGILVAWWAGRLVGWLACGLAG